eukprot:SAG31_NODE_1240_length_9167_cov_4.729599_9_plen_88_part_00
MRSASDRLPMAHRFWRREVGLAAALRAAFKLARLRWAGAARSATVAQSAKQSATTTCCAARAARLQAFGWSPHAVGKCRRTRFQLDG